MSTYSQIKQIHTLKNIIGLDDDTYREMLSSFDVWSSKNLTDTEANIFIGILNDKVKFTKKNCNKKFDDLKVRDIKMATPAQLRKMEVLWKEICNNKEVNHRKKTLRAYLKRQFHVDDIRFVSKKRAQKIIAVLEKIKEKKFLKAV